MSSFWGSGWGLTPWGGFALPGVYIPPPTPPAGFNIYAFYDAPASMNLILEDPSVSSEGGYFAISSDDDLCVSSGGSSPSTDALLFISSTVPATWTVQFTFLAHELPRDFTELVSSHVYMGNTDLTGASAGLFISEAGVAYSGDVHLESGVLQLGGPFQVIPDTAGIIDYETYYTVRIATDSETSTVYIFLTKTSDIATLGHRLLAIVPAIPSSGYVADGTTISVQGTELYPSWVCFDMIGLGVGLVMPNAPPRADAGKDQSLRMCSIGRLDGTASFDPEGGEITYSWRLIDAPVSSLFAFEGADGFTLPLAIPTGYTDKFYSAQMGVEAVLDPVLEGDVLLAAGVAYTITEVGVDGSGFFVRITSNAFTDSLVNVTYKVLRQRFLSGATTPSPTFYPDSTGLYKFDLVVYDGQYLSEGSATVVNVVESQVPKGCIPDLGFLWQYLSNFWQLVEDRERIQVFWEGLTQIVAAELMTLWQVDYNKSLRDIQRVFQRRWLHYDLKLPEPLPGMTSITQKFGGVTTTTLIPLVGVSGVQGTQLVVTSPVHSLLRISFQLADPYTAETLQEILRIKLRGVDARYAVTLVDYGVSGKALRIYAPFHFQLSEDSTIPAIFPAGIANAHLSGVSGMRLGSRTYKVGESLLGVEVNEGDLLEVGGECYKISRVVDDPSDALRYQRIVVQDDLPLLPGAAWSVPSYATSRLLNFYGGMLTARDIACLEVVDTSSNVASVLSAPVLGACASAASTLALDVRGLTSTLSSSGVEARLAYVLRKTRVPVGPLVQDIPCLQEHVKAAGDDEVLRRNIDYFLEEFRGGNSIRFVAGNPWDVGDVWEGEAPPDRLWAETTYLDNRPAISDNFGIPAEFTLSSLSSLATDVDYLSAVRGLWYSYLNGPTMFNLRVGSQILLGLPFAEEAGTIVEIRPSFSATQGRILVRDTANAALVRSYTYPLALELEVNPSTSLPYAVGDTVAQFAPLVKGVEIVDYVSSPEWFQGLLSQGIFFEVEKFHKFMVRVDGAAFSLSSLVFVRNFILRVKPTYTFPMFIVRRATKDTEVSISDVVTHRTTLHLDDGALYTPYNFSTRWDDYRAAGGGVANKFDTDGNPATPPPTYPTSEAVAWGYDKGYLAPEDVIVATTYTAFAGGTVAYDSGFFFDTGVAPSLAYTASAVASVPLTPASYTIGAGVACGVTADISSMKLVVVGDLGVDPGDYLLNISDGVTDYSEAVTVPYGGMSAALTLSTPFPATVGSTITVSISAATGGARAPNWAYVEVVLLQDAALWQFDAGLPAGTYSSTRTL